MEGLDTAVLICLAVLFLALNRVVKRLCDCLSAHVSDDNLAATPELIRVWKKQITNHQPGSAEYESYKRHLTRAGEWRGD